MANPGDISTEAPDEQPVGLTRRQALKKGAILGGALAWATPVVQVMGMKPAFAAVPSPVRDCVVRVLTGDTFICYLVTQEECACFEEQCEGKPGDEGCLNQCLEDRGIGDLVTVACPPA